MHYSLCLALIFGFVAHDGLINAATASKCADTVSNCPNLANQSACEGRLGPIIQQICPYSCNICGDDEATTPGADATPTLPSQETTTACRCKDILSNCEDSARLGACSGDFKEFFKKKCPKSCGVCDGCGDPTTTPPTEENTTVNECKDHLDNCHEMAKQGACNSVLKGYFEKECPKSCKICGDGDEEITTSIPATTPKPPPKEGIPAKECVDHLDNCKRMAEQGECYGSLSSYFLKECPYSCNACDDCDDKLPTLACISAAVGWCEKYSPYHNITQYCPRSCGKCPNCKDIYEKSFCQLAWKEHKCRKNVPLYQYLCKKTCRFCGVWLPFYNRKHPLDPREYIPGLGQ